MPKYNFVEDNGNVREGKLAVAVTRWTIMVIVVVAISSGAAWFVQNRTSMIAAPLQKEADVVKIQNDAGRALSTDRFFFDTYNNIVARQNDIKSSEQALLDFKKDNPQPWGYAAQTQYGNLQQTLQGQKSDIERMIAEYNSRSDQWGSNVYKADKLPNKIDPNNLPTGPIF